MRFQFPLHNNNAETTSAREKHKTRKIIPRGLTDMDGSLEEKSKNKKANIFCENGQTAKEEERRRRDLFFPPATKKEKKPETNRFPRWQQVFQGLCGKGKNTSIAHRNIMESSEPPPPPPLPPPWLCGAWELPGISSHSLPGSRCIFPQTKALMCSRCTCAWTYRKIDAGRKVKSEYPHKKNLPSFFFGFFLASFRSGGPHACE